MNPAEIPGVLEAGWKPPDRRSQRVEGQMRPSALSDLQAKLGAVLKVIKVRDGENYG